MKRLRAVILAFLMVMGLLGIAFAGSGMASATRGLAVGPTGDPFGSATIWTNKVTYRVGEAVRIGFKSSVNGYAAIYDYPTSGPSQMIWPRNGSPALVKAGRTYSVPDGKFSLTASEPLGTDTLVLVVSRIKANLTITVDLNLFFGLGSRGLTTEGGGVTISSVGGNEESIYAECFFQVTPRYSAPVLRVYGGAGARLFVDGSDRGLLSGSGTLGFAAGTHELVALLPGMQAESKMFYMRNNVTYDWSLRFQSLR